MNHRYYYIFLYTARLHTDILWLWSRDTLINRCWYINIVLFNLYDLWLLLSVIFNSQLSNFPQL